MSQDIKGKTFDGVLDGSGKTITISAGGCGLFGILGENAIVEDLTVAGKIAETAENCSGVIAGVNNGIVRYCTVSAGIESSIGNVGELSGDKDGITGGAGGVVGINNGTISDCVYSGQARAKVGVGGIAVINNGEIKNCTDSGTIGAGNAIESGSTTNSMSYAGGIAAINYGSIDLCTTTGRLLAQRSMQDSGTNNNIGGIAALNTAEGTIKRCAVNSQRIYGNKNVGGIAAENSGAISYCYVVADYRSPISSHNYIGGTANVGGIVGLTNSGATVSNCYATANVYAYEGAAYKLAQSSENCVYLDGNLDERNFTVIDKDNNQVSTQARALTVPEGSNNISIELTAAVKEEYATKSYALVLDDSQFATLNGTDGYYVSKTNVTIGISSVVKNKTIEVVVVVTGGNVQYSVNKSSGNKILPSAPDTETSYVVGYAMVPDSSVVVFNDGVAIGYSDLEIFNRDTIELYPVYADGARPQSTVLNIAVFGRFISGDMVAELTELFKTSQLYAGCTQVYYTVLSEYKVDDYSAAVKAGNADYGKYNISFGHKNLNVGQKSNVTINVVTADGTVDARQVGIIGNDTVASNFATFLATNDAKKILNPSYVEVTMYNGTEKIGVEVVGSTGSLVSPTVEPPEGKVFAGWSINQDVTEGETLYNTSVAYSALAAIAQNKAVTLYARFETASTKVVINIAVYKKFVHESVANKLKAAFEAYCDENNIVCDVNISYGITGNGAAFVQYAQNSDIAMGHGPSGANFNEDIVKATLSNLEIKQSDAATNKDRKAVRLTESAVAIAFMNFLQTDEGVQAMLGN